MSIFPYIYYMIASFHITQDTQKIAIYAGLVTSTFAFAEFSTGMMWGRLSDKVGRKPVLIGGLVGTAISMMVFGFAPSLPIALIARALGGLLNGNIGVLQTTVAELVTVKEHQPRAYSIMPFVWCLGSIVGPALGGALAQPCVSYPWLFARNTIFERYPFMLPNLVCTFILLCGIVIGILFLEETHPEKKHERDKGIEAGRWLIKKAWHPQREVDLKPHTELDLYADDQPPGYQTTEGSPQLTSSCPSSTAMKDERQKSNGKVGFLKAFNRNIVLNIVAYGLLA